ncbi:LCP family protein [Nocardioides sp. KR10-350]|uniref:LCP family protein n=1 Tax=Nocardioides cheoyonin TaxID=3156615 RepID=UPI0032B4FD04
MRLPELPTLHSDEQSGSVTPQETRPQGGKRRAAPPRKHTVLKVLGASLLVLVLITGLGMVYLYRHLNGNLTVLDIDDDIVGDRPDKVAVSGPHEPLNILVMGSDSRDCNGCNIDNLTGDGQRSDTTILIHLSADRKHAYGISIPRDSMVDRPECKNDDGDTIPAAENQMWNTAFSVGGPACTVSQVEHLTGIRVDHFVVVDFESFKSMVDAIGGVEVCIPETWDDRAHGIYLKAGTRRISGNQALNYVRIRHGIGDGSDLGRAKRQQAFIGSMAAQVLSSNTLANPVKVVKFLDAATKGLTVDKGMDNLKKMGELAYGFKDIGLNKIQFMTIPVEYDPDDPARVIWTPEANRVWKRLRKDKPLTKRLTASAIDAGSTPGASKKKGHKKSDGESSGSSGTGSSGSTGGSGQDAAKKAELEQAGLCT